MENVTHSEKIELLKLVDHTLLAQTATPAVIAGIVDDGI